MVFSRCLIEEFLTAANTGDEKRLDMHTAQTDLPKVTTGTNLLDIPPELRPMIYSFLPDGRVLQDIYPDSGFVETYGFNPPDRGSLSLSQSCRLIHDEVSDKLYSSLSLSIYAKPPPHHPYEWTTKALWDSLGQLPGHLRHARHVKMEIDVTLSFGKVDVPHIRALAYLHGPKAFLTALRHSGNTKQFECNFITQRYFHLRETGSGTEAGNGRKDQEFDRAETLVTQLEHTLLE